jgi:hypothetical protein
LYLSKKLENGIHEFLRSIRENMILAFELIEKIREQNLVVFASNWRSGNLAFEFIEEVGEWNPLFQFQMNRD